MNEKRVLKRFEELRFRDDFMFGKVMEDPVLCREVLECLLEREIGELKEPRLQREYRYTSEGKPIRVDVMNEDDSGELFDAEMENLNHKKIKDHTLPKRCRFYQSAIDIDYLNKGESYKKLPESNVLFICTFDPFEAGLSRYTFRERCDEKLDMELGDGTRKLFFNCSYKGNDISDEQRNLYDYIMRGVTGSSLTKKIDEAVVKGRKNEIWRTQYMKEWVIIEEAREEGENLFAALTQQLLSEQKYDDLQKATTDPDYRGVLYRKYGLKGTDH